MRLSARPPPQPRRADPPRAAPRGGFVHLVDPEDGRKVATLDTGLGVSASFDLLALSPAGSFLAAGREHVVHLWDGGRSGNAWPRSA